MINQSDELLVRNAINAQDDDSAWQAFNRILVDLDTTRQNNWDLCVAVREHYEALTAVYTFLNAYLIKGGDPNQLPKEWLELDEKRHTKYVTLLQLAGVST